MYLLHVFVAGVLDCSFMHQPQVFQTNSTNRWQRFKWSSRLMFFVLACAVVILIIAIITIDKEQQQIPLEKKAQKVVLTSNNPLFLESKLASKYKGFRKYIADKWTAGKGWGQYDSLRHGGKRISDSVGIRAAFYVAWDPQSFTSLEDNISKINMVLPEWLFIDTATDAVKTNIDTKALLFIRSAHVNIMPMLTNNIGGKFRGDIIHRILNNPVKRAKLIHDLDSILTTNHFTGINIDLEELIESSDETLISFQTDLYKQLHSKGLLVSQDIIPFNEDYNLKALGKCNDYLFLMAYDEHSDDGVPGPICSQKWVEAAVGKMLESVPANKIILGVAGYGFDWQKGAKHASQVSFQEALSTARESDAVVQYDNDTYNLYYEYYDGDDVPHQVHFTDAATTFNTLRFATESQLAGTALWRLGSEDSRMWKFYDLPMTMDALKSFDFNSISDVEPGNQPDYIGEGEILDLLATPTPGHITLEIDSADMLLSEENYDKLPSTFVIKKYGDTRHRKLVLTFDDGPDPLYTRQILDTLAFYHVPANFFVVGIQAEENIPLVKRIYREGHEVSNHTFTHPNMAQVSRKRALVEMDATRLLIECITGHSTIMFRAPFNADSEPGKYEELAPVALSRTRNYITVGESIDPEDWEKGERPDFNADTIFNRVVRTYEARMNNPDPEDTTGINGNIILLHDAGGDRSETVKATGKIIRFFQSKGYTFTTVAGLLGKTRDQMMPPVPKGSGYYLIQFNAYLFEFGYIVSNIMFALFIFFLILSFIRLSFLGFLAVKKQRQKQVLAPLTQFPLVSIIVPAFNEEVNVVASLNNLLRCTYPNFNIVFVDDGSKDSTFEKATAAFKDNPKIKLFTKANGGKSSALNYGISQTDAPFLVCIDADTKLQPDAVGKLMLHFTNEKVGAVAGNVKVGNEVNLLTRWQSIEYICSQNFDRKAFSVINAITVVPGAIGAFRKEAIEIAGGFTPDTLAEDCDLTFRILESGYIIEDEPGAIALTEAPEKVKQFMKQRFRWSFGIMQAFWKHRGMLFNTSGNRALGWIAMPDILLFKYIIPFFSPLADVFMLIGLVSGNATKIGHYYLVFLVVDAAIAAIAFSFERERYSKLIWLLPQRLVYRWFILIILFRSIRRAIKGELQYWGVLKRTGNVKEVTPAME